MLSDASAWIGLGFLLSELGLAIRRRATASGDTVDRDAGSLRLLWIVIALSVVAGVLLSSYGVRPYLPAGYPWPVLGMGLFMAGALLRWWSIWHLGRFFTVNVSVAADHRVVDTGPYRLIRHPSYSGLLLQFAGLGLTLGMFPALVVVLVLPTLALLHRIRVEEFTLSAHLPDSYPAYVARTKKIVPLVF